jgi:hypothetical protein
MMKINPTTALALALALSCARTEPAPVSALEFRPQCFADDPGAIAAEVQGIPAWFGPPRRFAIAGIFAATDAQGHPAIRVELAPEAHASFAAFTSAGVSGPVGLFVDGALIAVPSIQPIADGRFTFCNEAGGWSAADRDAWLARMRAAEGD